ncbi:MAG: histidinol-phosphate transaminase [Idiomarina sp. 34-48-12]|nr:MAG: histidinol-phosphate transaminase [Idiomarina sp. 34-48-12]
MTLAATLQRAHLAELTPYASARRSMSGGAVWLNANEAPVTPVLAETATQLNRYPSFQSAALNQAYADYAQVNAEQVLSCRGSDEAIDLLIRSFCEPGQDAVMITTPTYGMYAISAQTQGAGVVDVPLVNAADGTLQLNVDGMLVAMASSSQRIKLVFVCNPSNPLGNNVNLAELQRLIESVGDQALVVVDEAYIEFAAHELATNRNVQALNEVSQWLAKYPQLVVMRTLSKAFGLAAIRCGFALANTDVIDVLRKVIAPYPMPQPCLDIAEQALSATGIRAMQQAIAETTAQRLSFIQAIANKPWVKKVWPSCTNFVLLDVENAEQLVEQCRLGGVLIRNQSAQRGLNNSVRVSIGSAAEMQQLMEVLP